jgi:hypothetical protein
MTPPYTPTRIFFWFSLSIYGWGRPPPFIIFEIQKNIRVGVYGGGFFQIRNFLKKLKIYGWGGNCGGYTVGLWGGTVGGYGGWVLWGGTNSSISLSTENLKNWIFRKSVVERLKTQVNELKY